MVDTGLRIPRGRPVTIDGRMDDKEWADSTMVEIADGVVIRLRHDGFHLFFGIISPEPGYGSICIAQPETISVLHASARLGSVIYSRFKNQWISKDIKFVFGMNDPDLAEQAKSERSEYLLFNGWVASTFNMGSGLVQEYQISLDRFPDMKGIALAFVVISGERINILTWPKTLMPNDGCGDRELVLGFVPLALSFDPSRWAKLILER